MRVIQESTLWKVALLIRCTGTEIHTVREVRERLQMRCSEVSTMRVSESTPERLAPASPGGHGNSVLLYLLSALPATFCHRLPSASSIAGGGVALTRAGTLTPCARKCVSMCNGPRPKYLYCSTGNTRQGSLHPSPSTADSSPCNRRTSLLSEPLGYFGPLG